MTLRYELDLIDDETGETVSLSGELADVDRELLEVFIECAEEVLATQYIQSGAGGNLNIKWEADSGMQVKTELPLWDDVIVFLHKFRPLLLQNERTNFYKIHNLLARNLSHPYFRGFLKYQHDLFSGKTEQSMIQIRSNDVLLNSEKVLFDWLNSHEFHREKDKREFIQSLHQMIPLDMSKVIFLRLLSDKAIAVSNFADFIRVLLGKQRATKFKGTRV